MTEKMIKDAYCKIRTIDQTIPDDVLDFMKDAAIEKLNNIKYKDLLETSGSDMCEDCGSNEILYYTNIGHFCSRCKPF